MYIENMVTTHG